MSVRRKTPDIAKQFSHTCYLILSCLIYLSVEWLLQLVEPMVTDESELMFQWQVYLAVYGYAACKYHSFSL